MSLFVWTPSPLALAAAALCLQRQMDPQVPNRHSQSRRALEPSSTSSRGFISVSLRSFGLQQQEIKGAWRHARLPPLLDLCEPLSLMKIAAHSDKGPRICWLYNNAGAVNRPWGECVCVCGGCGLHVIHDVDNQFYDCLGVIHTASASWFRFSWLNFFSFSFFVLWTFCIDSFFFSHQFRLCVTQRHSTTETWSSCRIYLCAISSLSW